MSEPAAAAEGREPFVMVVLGDWYQDYCRYVVPWSSLIKKHAPPGPGKHAQIFRLSMPNTIPKVRSKAAGKRLRLLYEAVAEAHDGEKSIEYTFRKAMERLGGRPPTDGDYTGKSASVYINMNEREWR